jgi:probable rRNA maturation factor
MSASDTTAVMAADQVRADPPPAAEMRLEIVHQAGDWSGLGARDDRLRRTARALAGHPRGQAAAGATAGIALSCDRVVRELNRLYRGQDKPTNVLSFPFPAVKAPSDGVRYLGDLILGAETVRHEAAKVNIPPLQHLQHLVVHGLLHLIGFNHVTDAEARQMETIEAEVLATLGIANPYDDRVA